MSIIFLFSLVCLFLFVIVLLYFNIYKKNCNEVLMHEGTHKRIPAPSNVSRILLGVGISIIILGNNLQVKSLDSKLSKMSSDLSRLQNQMNMIQNDQQEWKKEQSSILRSFEYFFGEMNQNDFTIPVTVKVIPKTYTDETEVMLDTKQEIYQLKRNGDLFETTINVNVFDKNLSDCIIIVSNGEEKKTEVTERFLVELIYKYLPYIEVACFTDVNSKLNSSNSKLHFTSKLALYAKAASEETESTFTEIMLVSEVNGKVVKEESLMEKLTYENGDMFMKEFLVEDERALSNQDVYEVYVRAIDSYGLIHKSDNLLCYKDGNITYGEGIESIYTKTGECLR